MWHSGRNDSFFQTRISSEIQDLVSITSRVTPVPIPNTTVKPLRADDTSGEALRESKSSPDFFHGFIAQSVEQRTENPRVLGSIPSEATKKNHIA